MDKIALIMISALLALTLSSCSEPRTISGTWIQDKGQPWERTLTVNEQSGTWSITYTNSPASNADGSVESSEDRAVFRLNNTIYLGEGHRPAKTDPKVAIAHRAEIEPGSTTLRLEIEDERGYVLSGTWEKLD